MRMFITYTFKESWERKRTQRFWKKEKEQMLRERVDPDNHNGTEMGTLGNEFDRIRDGSQNIKNRLR